MRSGWSVASVPNCSAMTRGEGWGGAGGANLRGEEGGGGLGKLVPAGPRRVPLGARRDVGDQHRGGRRGNRADVVVLGVPDPPVAEGLGPAGQLDTPREALA